MTITLRYLLHMAPKVTTSELLSDVYFFKRLVCNIDKIKHLIREVRIQLRFIDDVQSMLTNYQNYTFWLGGELKLSKLSSV